MGESIVERARKYLMVTFTGIVIAGTIYNILTIGPPTVGGEEQLKRKKVKKVKKEEDKPSGPKPVEQWDRKELFAFLTENKIYPDISTSTDELIALVLEEQKKLDALYVEEIVFESIR